MKISEIFKLKKTQYELDFVDIDIDKDMQLFLDPYYISKINFPFAEESYKTLKNFFDYLLGLLKENYVEEAEEIFSYLGESNELCLGLSKGKPSGKGMGPKDCKKIFESLVKSKAYKTGVMEDIEDFRIFVPNVDKDKTSDMVSNIIKWQLIEYTQEQCKLWGIPLQSGIQSGVYWDTDKKEWDNTYTEMLVVEGKKVILVPKRIVSYSKVYTDKKYLDEYVLSFLQNEHLKLNSVLVRERVQSNEKYVTKKDVREYEEKKAKLDKEWLAEFTKRNPEVFDHFKKDSINKITTISNEEICDVDLEELLDYLKNKLLDTPTGNKDATNYHRLIVGIMELLFYPGLSNPIIEAEINDKRKRIDITFDNCAEQGFFSRLMNTHGIPSKFIIVECKNFSEDVKNPELDQLCGRFSPVRGKVGIIACRKIKKMDVFITRCNDSVKEERGYVIPLVDEDFIYMLDNYADNRYICEEVLQKKFRKICLN